MGSKRERPHSGAGRPPALHEQERTSQPRVLSPRRHLRKPARHATAPVPGDRPDPTLH